MYGLIFTLLCNVQAIPDKQEDAFFKALHIVESGDGKHMVGDNGKAIGPYQIWEVYWKDAIQFDPSIGGCYKDCMNEAYARKIVTAYLNRYAKNKSIEDCARIHNGGPKGHRKQATIKYWLKVKEQM